jgi:hypothetical protein
MGRLTSILAIVTAIVGTLVLFPSRGVVAQGDAPALGTPVPYVDADGVARGSITVTEVIDPFEEYNPDYPPEPGSRVVAVTVAVDADAGDRFEVTPWAIVLQDSDGFIWNQGSVFFASDMLIPELTSQTLAPGSRITGVVGFVLPETVDPARVFYQPESNRLITLAELSTVPPPALGETIGLADTNGGTGTVTVTEVVDPFGEFDPAYPPEPGTRFVAFTLVYENTGAGRFDIEPYGLLLRDANGNLWYPASLFRSTESIVVPDLTSDQLAPGDRLSGLVAFAVPDGVGLAGLHLSPTSSQLLTLARLGDAADQPLAKPSAATPTAQTEAAELAVVAADDPCAALQSWLAASRDRIDRATAIALDAQTATDTDQFPDQAAAFGVLADEQLAAAVPAAAEAVNKALIATLRASAAALEQSDPAVALAAVNERFGEIGAELDRLALDCGRS